MQLKIASVVGLLASITPALASTPLVQDIQQITLASANVRDTFKDMQLVNMIRKFPVGSIYPKDPNSADYSC